MKTKTLLVGTLLLSSWAYAANAIDVQPDPVLGRYLSPHGPASVEKLRKLDRKQVKQARSTLQTSSNSYTYLRCYYATGSKLKPTADYVWGLVPGNADYYRVEGYWRSSSPLAWKNMFYSDTSQDTLKSVCAYTLKRLGLTSNVALLTAANNALSYNHTIWSIDSANQSNRINKIIAFGDSLSDNQNVYNASQWLLPNRNSWFLGRFTNGYTWVEYLASELKLPLFNWAVGGAGTDTEKFVIAGITDQVESWKEYMQKAPAYQPENTLFTVLIGGNDFVNYDRSVEHVITNQKRAIQTLVNAGARNILLLKLPDVSRAPISKYKDDANSVADKVLAYNSQLVEMAAALQAGNGNNLNIQIFDSYTLFNSLLNNPADYGMTNTTQPCLNINGGSHMSYLSNPGIRDECVDPDSFVFWDVLHPTTRTHQLLSEHIAPFVRAGFKLATP